MQAEFTALLGASSSLLAVTALLYALWYPEMRRVRDQLPGINKDVRGRQADALRTTYRSKAIPLLLISAVQLAVFLPEVISVVRRVVVTFMQEGAAAVGRYDAIQAAFLATYLGVLALGAITLREGALLEGELRRWKADVA